jgi:predicted alpha/beta-fold hydrolase
VPIVHKYRSFSKPWWQLNGHLQTIYPSIKRTVSGDFYERERFFLTDGDFLDLDWVRKGSDRLVIITHGLEGNTQRHYVKGPAKLLADAGFDVLAWNCRSCSGELNLLPKLYHHGDIFDIGEVIEYALGTKAYHSIDLLGFSMGGNISIKYAAKHKHPQRQFIRSVISISAPTDLLGCVVKMEKWPGTIYGKKFFNKLSDKIKQKESQFPGLVNRHALETFKSWYYFDTEVSAPLNGYPDADTFYFESSSINFLPAIHDVPVFILSAWNDPILCNRSLCLDIADQKDNVFVEATKAGGHTGFMQANDSFTYAEHRILSWLKEEIISLA